MTIQDATPAALRAASSAHSDARADEIGIDNIRAAAQRIRGHISPTPVLRSRNLDAATGATLAFKCENFQRAGAFKFRGACNAVWSLPEDVAKNGVVTHSSGNH